MGYRWLATAAGVAAAALVVAACGSNGSSTGSSNNGSGSGSKSAHNTSTRATTLADHSMSGAMVLTTSKGFTVYWFAPDTSTKSRCNGACAKFWPPVKGPASASGVHGTFGSITRSDGSTQATFDGHPLYTYVGDKAPGQANGNNLNASGGVWHEVTVSGAAAPAPKKKSSSGGGGGGGYSY